jgi:hypothetical protein
MQGNGLLLSLVLLFLFIGVAGPPWEEKGQRRHGRWSREGLEEELMWTYETTLEQVRTLRRRVEQRLGRLRRKR